MDDQLQTGALAEAAAQPDLNVSQPVQEAQGEQMVPVTALQAERRERQQLQENIKILQDHLALMQANQAKKPEPEGLDSLRDDDVLTVGEAKKFIGTFQRQQQMAVEELKIAQQYPDYSDVVRKYLPNVLKDDPDLKDVIMNAPNPYKAAYYLAKRSDSYLQEQRNTQRSPEAKQAAANLQRPGNLSAVGQSIPASQASNWKQMSDADFMKYANRNLGYS